MSNLQIAPYGSWKSPITPEALVQDAVGLGRFSLDGKDIYWNEMRPSEGGRNVIVRCTPGGQITDITPAGFSARTTVHEYGGGEFIVADGVVYFSNFADQRLYRQPPDEAPQPLTVSSGYRYADYEVDRQRGRLIAVREDHTDSSSEAVNTLVSLSIDGDGDGAMLASGHDFYSTPRLSPDGSTLAWLSWNHPNMPWDGTELWIAPIQSDGSLGHATLVAGGTQESIFQPEWSPDGVLYFVSDRTGWWNLYHWQDGLSEPVLSMEAEFGLAQWVFGMRTYGFQSPTVIICAYQQNGEQHLARVDVSLRTLETVTTPYEVINYLRVEPDRAVFVGGSASLPSSVALLDLTDDSVSVLREGRKIILDSSCFSIPASIEFKTANEQTAHGFFYAPHNPEFAAPAGELPPLLVMSHGGPTASTDRSLSFEVQFWTSRGFAVLDVNYGGSTGYGRAYRQRLNGQWGVVDVEDCINGARHLVERRLVDEKRLVITGGSAGGFTTLAALTFHDVFTSGSSRYGISDLETLATDTHKFESRYLDSMVGPYPEQQEVYIARSPIHYTHLLNTPMILFQGLDDHVVPPDQSHKMFEAVRARELPVAYVSFEGEQHGFRKKETIKRVAEAELYFFGRVYGFTPADEIEPIVIENLD